MRDRFNVPDNYFLSHSVGCLPKSTPDVVKRRFFEPWQNAGGYAWDNWLQIIEDFRHSIAELIGAKKKNICPQTNISSALTKLLYSLPERPGRKTIVLSEKDYPTIGFVFDRARSAGYALKFINGDVTDPGAWSAAIDETTEIVHITHALSNTSHVLPVADICQIAHQAGAVSIVDAAQSAGIAPIISRQWNADFILGTSIKFLCGGPGACFLAASDKMLEICEPVDVGWFSHETPFEMDIHHFTYAKDAMRFLGGTPSPAPLVSAINGMTTLKETGLLHAQDHAQDALDRLCECVPDEALVSPRDRNARGGTLVVAPSDPMNFQSVLDENKVFCDSRTEGFRFSVHGYTSEKDINTLSGILNLAF